MKQWIKVACLVVTASLLSGGQSKQSQIEQKTEPQTAKSGEKNQNPTASETSHGPMDILSDTGGVDVSSYLSRVLPLIETNWHQLVPTSAANKRGKVIIRFNIMKDGHIKDVRVVESSGDIMLDRPAYGGISGSNPLPLLPTDFGCKFLTLQIRFYYNLQIPPSEQRPKDNLIPCVTTRIGSVQPVAIAVFPVSAELITGSKQQFSVRVTGAENAEVKWTVSGSGCSESACGTISTQGLYVAPSSIPNPLKLIVTATFASDATATATATVTVVKSPTSQ